MNKLWISKPPEGPVPPIFVLLHSKTDNPAAAHTSTSGPRPQTLTLKLKSERERNTERDRDRETMNTKKLKPGIQEI